MSAQSPILKLWVGDAFIRNAGMLQSWAKRTVVVTPLTLEWYFDTALTKIAGSVPLKGATLIPAKKVLANLSGYHLVCVDLDWSGRDFFPLRFVMTEAHDAILAFTSSAASVSEDILRLCGVNTEEINGLRSSLYGDDSLGGGAEGGVDESIETDTPIFEYAYDENGGTDGDADGVANEDGDDAENYPRREWPSHPDEVAFFDEYSAHATVEEVQNAQGTQVASQQESLPQTMRANLASAQAARAAALGDALRRHGSPRDRAAILSHFESALRDGEVPSAAELTMRAAAERMMAASMMNDPTGPSTVDRVPAVPESNEEDVDAADVIYDGELAVAIDSERVPYRQHVAVARGVLSCSPIHGPDVGAVSMFTLVNSHVTLDLKALPPAIVLHAGLRRVQLAPLSEGDLRVWLSALTEAGAALDARAASMRDGLSPSIIGALGLSNETTIILQPPVATPLASAGSSDSVEPTVQPPSASSAAPAAIPSSATSSTAVTAATESVAPPVPIPVADDNNPPAAVFLLVRAKTPPPPPRTSGEAITAPQLVHESSVWAPRLGALSKDGYLRLWGAAADGSISKTPSEVYFLKGSKAQTSFPLPGLPIDTAPFTVQLSREAAEQAKLPQDAASCILLACPGGRPAVLTWIAAMQSLVSGLESKVDETKIDEAAGLGEGIDISAFPALAQKQKRPAPSAPAQSSAGNDAPPAFLQAPPPVPATKSAVSEIISPTKIAPAPIPSLTGTDSSLPLLPSPWSSAATLASSLRDEVRGLAVALDALDASQVANLCTSGGRGVSANTNDAVAEAAALVRMVSDRLAAVDDLAVSLGSAAEHNVALASTDKAVARIAAALASACETPLSASLSQSVTLLRDAATGTIGVDSAVARRAQRTIHVDGLLAVSLRGTLVGLNAPQTEVSVTGAAPKAVAPVDAAASSAIEAAVPERVLLLSKAPHAPSLAHERALLAYHMRLPEWVVENESDAVNVISRDWKAFGPRLWPLLASIHGIGAVAPFADSLSIPRSLLDINAWDAAAAACAEVKEVAYPIVDVESAVKSLLGTTERTPWVRPVTVKPWQIARSEDAARVDAILAEADAVEASFTGVTSAAHARLPDSPGLPVVSASVSAKETFSPRGSDTSSSEVSSQSIAVPAPATMTTATMTMTTTTTTTTAMSSPSQTVSVTKRAPPRRVVAWNQSTTLEAPPNDEARVSLRRSNVSKASSSPAAEFRESMASPTLAPGSLIGTFSRRGTATKTQGHSSNILRAAWNKSVLTRWSKQPGVAEKLSLINVEGRELPEEIVPAPEYKVPRVGGGALKGALPAPPPPRRHVREPLSGVRALEATAAAAAAAVPLPVVFPQAAPALAHVPTPKTRSRASSNATKQNHAPSDDEEDGGTPQHVRALRAFRSNSVVAAVVKDTLQSPPPPLHPGTKIPRAAPATPQRDGSMPPMSPARSSISSTGSSIPSPSRAAPRSGTATDGTSAALAFVVSQIDTLLSPNSRAASSMSSVASAPPLPPAKEVQPSGPSAWRPNLKEAASALRAEKKSKSDILQEVLASRARAPLSAAVSPVVSPPGRSLKSLEKLSALAAQDEAVSSPKPPAPPPGPLSEK